MSIRVMHAVAIISAVIATALVLYGIFTLDNRFIYAGLVVFTAGSLLVAIQLFMLEEERVSECYEEYQDDVARDE